MFASLSRLGMPGVNIVPRRGPVHERDHCSHCDPPHSLFSSSCSCSCSSSYTDESSSLPSSRPRTPFDSKGGRPVTAGSESRLELAHRAIAPSSRHPPPPRPARNPARIHKEAPTRNKLVSESGEGKTQVARRLQVEYIPARVAPSPHPPPSRPLPYPPGAYPTQSPLGTIRIPSHSNTAQKDTATVQPPMPLLPVLPVFLTREASSSSSTSTSTSSSTSSTLPHSDTMLAVPLLHPSTHQGSPAKKDHQQLQQGQQPQSHPGAQLADSNKHRSKCIFPSRSGSMSPPPASPANLLFLSQHPSVSTLNLSASSRNPLPHLPTPAIHSLPSPPSHSPRSQRPYATPSSSSLQTASNSLLSQDSRSDITMSTKSSIDRRDPSFRFRGPLGHPLWGLPVGVASESRQPAPPIPTHPPSSFSMSMSGKRHKLRNSLSPLRAGLPERDDFAELEDRRMRGGGMSTLSG